MTAPEPITILLVDDDRDCRMLVRDAIVEGRPDADVHEVGSVAEALDFLHGRGAFAEAPRPDLIYLDIDMPGPSGQELLKLAKCDERTREIPIVMLTGLDDPLQKHLAARNGANSYNVKPADAGEFFRSVRRSTDYWLRVHQYPRRNTA